MLLVIVTEQRLRRTPDNCFWTTTGSGYQFWRRYLQSFDAVRLLARVVDCESISPRALRVDGIGVDVSSVPYYVGPARYIAKSRAVHRVVENAARPEDAVLLRVPSQLGNILAGHRQRRNLPYFLEVVGDPHDVFSKGSISHPLRRAMRRRFTSALKEQCRYAVGVSYVTKSTLQTRYPAAEEAVVSHYSSIELDPSFFAATSRAIEDPRRVGELISVGSLEQMYKGIDVLIHAVCQLRSMGVRVHLTHLGEGRHMAELKRLADRLAVSDAVTFVGAVPAGDEVRRYLGAADLFVHPSRTEGLPRALIEAMAVGIPAVASNVGGIPELIEESNLVPPGDASGLAHAIGHLLADPRAMAHHSSINLERARDFASGVLAPRRQLYYQSVRRILDDMNRPRLESGSAFPEWQARR